MLNPDKRAVANQELFQKWRDARANWDIEARKDIDFYLGNHFDEDEVEDIEARNQAPVAFDRIYPGIQTQISMLTARPPRYMFGGREDSDSDLAMTWQIIHSRLWEISEGNRRVREALLNFATTGLGYLYVYINREADYGRGEVMFKDIPPFRVYVSPDTADRLQHDASGKILSSIMSGQQLINIHPKLESYLKNGQVETTMERDYPPTQQSDEIIKVWTPDSARDLDWNLQYYQVLEHFYPVKVPFYRVFDRSTRQDRIFSQLEIEDFIRKNFVRFKRGEWEYEEVPQRRIKREASVGGRYLGEEILDTEYHPLIPIPNIWTGTVYPKSDVSKARPIQRLLDKFVSIILAHAQASAGLKLLVPMGSVSNIEQLELDWANPVAVVEYDASMGEPHYPAPSPLASEFYAFVRRVEFYIDFEIGIPELMQGVAESAPETARGTLAVADFAQGRPRAKLQQVEDSMLMLGRVMLDLAKSHYTYEKTFRIVQPNNDINEVTINYYDDKRGVLNDMYGDLRTGVDDISIYPGSMLPTSRLQEAAIYMEAYEKGLIDRVEALKKMEIFDKKGVLERMDTVTQLMNLAKEQQEYIKELEGDLQTADREVLHSKRQSILDKYKGRFEEVFQKVKAQKQVDMMELKKSVELMLGKLEAEIKAAAGSTANKEEKSKGEKK